MKKLILIAILSFVSWNSHSQGKLMIFDSFLMDWSDSGLVTYIDFPSYDTSTFLFTTKHRYVHKNKSHYFFLDVKGPKIETHLKNKLRLLRLGYDDNLNSLSMHKLTEQINNLDQLEQVYYCVMWLCNNLDYDITTLEFDLDTALRKRRGVCRHYTEALDLMFKMLGLNSIMMDGTLLQDSSWHVWNLVEIDNDWYYVDATGFDNNHNFDFLLIDKSFFKNTYKPRHQEAIIK